MIRYDVITVGSGLVGTALPRSLVEAGLRVMILEREAMLRDRVRGEGIHCWGVAETRALGIYDILKKIIIQESRYSSPQLHGTPAAPPRDLAAISAPQMRHVQRAH